MHGRQRGCVRAWRSGRKKLQPHLQPCTYVCRYSKTIERHVRGVCVRRRGSLEMCGNARRPPDSRSPDSRPPDSRPPGKYVRTCVRSYFAVSSQLCPQFHCSLPRSCSSSQLRGIHNCTIVIYETVFNHLILCGGVFIRSPQRPSLSEPKLMKITSSPIACYKRFEE